MVSGLKRLAYHFPLRWMAGLLPVEWVSVLGRVLAEIEYWTIRPASRATLRRNMASALGLDPDSIEAKRFSKDALRHYVWNALEYAVAHRLWRQGGRDFIEIVGWEHVEAALAGGKGVVVGVTHFATVEAGIAALAWNGCSVAAIEPGEACPDNAPNAAERMIQRYRHRHQRDDFKYDTIYTGGAVAKAQEHLAKGGVVIVAIDYPPAREKATCPFLGRERRLPSGAAYIALTAGAPMVVSRIERLEFGHNRLTFLPVAAPPTGDLTADMVALGTELTRVLEGFVRHRPEQWAWFLWREF